MFKLLFASLLGAFFSAGVIADNAPPSAIRDLRSVRYSTTAGEIQWSAASDNVIVVGYKVYRDGRYLGLKDARSVYESNLASGKAYQYRVSAVDRSGNEGPVAEVTIAARSGVRNQGQVVAGSGGALQLSTAVSRLSLKEGDSAGVSLNLTLRRLKSPKRPVSLSLEADGKDLQAVRYQFSRGRLSANETSAVLTLKLDVSVAPLQAHQRNLYIVADDGISRAETTVRIDVIPTDAPDVYLLIGQSNMEGYSELGSRERFIGGKDERVERIKQLNVQPNSATIFSRDSLYTNERANVRKPYFVIAEDPLHEPRYITVEGKEATFIGLGMTFAKKALSATTADIYLVPAAWGATGFCANGNGNRAWNASPTSESFLGGTLLADRALTRLNMTLRETGGILRGIFWHQGGADSNNANCAKSYADNLAKLVKRLRREARRDLRGSAARGDTAAIPFIVATQSKGNDSRGTFANFSANKRLVDKAHRTVGSYISDSTFVNNDDLVPPRYPCGQASCVHFGAAALREQGRRFNIALRRVLSRMGAYHY